MSVAQQKKTVPPLALRDILNAAWAMHTLKAGIELKLFDVIEKGANTACEVANEAKTDEKGTGLILDALVGLGLLEKQEGKVRLTEVAELYLVSSSQLFIGDYLKQHEELSKVWDGLARSLRSGKPVVEVNDEKKAEQFFPQLVAAIFPQSYTTAAMVADELHLAELPTGSRVLDVAAGSGVWSIPIAKACPGVTVDALDLQPVLNVTKKYTTSNGVADRYNYLAGSWRDVVLSDDTYDVAILGHILHSEGREQGTALVGKVSQAIKKGGRLIIAEFVANDEKTAPSFALLFALNMYLLTTDGCVFTEGELKSMLEEHGLTDVCRLRLPYYGSQSPVVVARKG